MQVIGHTSDAEIDAIGDSPWRESDVLVRTLTAATPEQVARLAAARAAAGATGGGSVVADATGGAIDAAGIAMCAAWCEARDVDAAWAAATEATRTFGGVWSVEWQAAWEAALALIVRDVVGRYGFEQHHYDLLSGPWRAVFGPLHPDDAAA